MFVLLFVLCSTWLCGAMTERKVEGISQLTKSFKKISLQTLSDAKWKAIRDMLRPLRKPVLQEHYKFMESRLVAAENHTALYSKTSVTIYDPENNVNLVFYLMPGLVQQKLAWFKCYQTNIGNHKKKKQDVTHAFSFASEKHLKALPCFEYYLDDTANKGKMIIKKVFPGEIRELDGKGVVKFSRRGGVEFLINEYGECFHRFFREAIKIKEDEILKAMAEFVKTHPSP